ncbi:hypothetical protein [Anaeromyxobacter dehalogenans]|uniref:hypothetical protein n=1 Tax=Anaeromyxobacter dehalogenans TaxID=161493 RepID=UPI0012376457|nr:hypothetical protein [Anaeromyxobacter dehalogenans]
MMTGATALEVPSHLWVTNRPELRRKAIIDDDRREGVELEAREGGSRDLALRKAEDALVQLPDGIDVAGAQQVEEEASGASYGHARL